MLDLSGAAAILLRHGGVTLEELAARLGPVAAIETDPAAPRSPGSSPAITRRPCRFG